MLVALLVQQSQLQEPFTIKCHCIVTVLFNILLMCESCSGDKAYSTEFNEQNNRLKFVYFAFNNLTAGQMNKTTKERQED